LPVRKPPAEAREPIADAADAALLARLRRRETLALAALTHRHGPALARAAYLHLGDTHAADDAVQDTLLAAWDAAPRTTEGTALRPWLLGILLNRCRKMWRSHTRRRRREQAAAQLRAAAGADEVTHVDEQLEALRDALMRLDEPLRCVVILRHQQGLSVADTAAVLRVPPGTVKSRSHKAIAMLRRLMCES
jgi:RNA polymerase sigma-70 factor (ECF subfamily)